MLVRMTGRLLVAAILALTVLRAEASAQPQTGPGAGHAPVVVELYTSQGCFSCPRANRLLGEFSRDADVLALTFPVGYWDYLGWEDTFAQPEFVDRQRAYSRALRFRGPYTPQLVIDGVRHVSAGDWDESRAVLDEVRAQPPVPGAPTITLERTQRGQVRAIISAGVRQALTPDIWFITYDPGPLTVLITSGENANRRVSHYNLVRRISRVGAWNGGATWFERNRCYPECVVLLQEPRGGRIIAAASTHQRTR